jgi:transposase-like protein
MNYFLMMIIVALCGGGYYEYTDFQQKNAADQQQIHDLGSKVDKLQAANKALEDDKTRLTKSVNDAQTEVADLAKQIQAAQSTLAEAKQQAPQAPQANTSAAPTTAATPPTNDLGTITTLTGKTYQNCQLLKVKADGIVVSHSEGITEIVFGSLPPELQKKFGYDPHQALTLTEAQIQLQETQRKAAAARH